MTLDSWLRFTWDVTRLAAIERPLPTHYRISRATAEDEKEIRKVISSSFVLDPTWNAVLHDVSDAVEQRLEDAFSAAEKVVLALRHGTRIIGATVVALSNETDLHLAPGPCLLIEYRNRGFGTHLLEHALATIRDAGVMRATGVAKQGSPAAKFLYTKFQSISAPYQFVQLAAA